MMTPDLINSLFEAFGGVFVLGQSLSYYAGCFLVAANALWVGLLIRFRGVGNEKIN